MATGALADIRVLETGQLIAGPFCGQLLGDFGAEVIKLEDPRAGDPMRQWGSGSVHGLNLQWPILARNKKSVTCNLRSEEGQELCRRLAAVSDVVIENFRPGTLERWGLGWEQLSELNPRLVLVRVTGYGQTGPYAGRAGYGAIGEAMGGLRYLSGDPDRPPARVGISLGDELAATFAALGTLLALHARERTGRGQVVDSSIYEAVLAMTDSLVPEWQIAKHRRERSGSTLPGIAPSNVYPAADGAEVLIAGNGDTVFARLCEAIGEPELASDSRYATHQARGSRQVELDEHISAWTRRQPSEALLELMHRAGVPAGRIYTAADMLADPQFAARQSIVHREHPEHGDFPMQNVAPKLSETPGEIRWLGPALGEHNDEIYRGLLELDGAELERLAASGTI